MRGCPKEGEGQIWRFISWVNLSPAIAFRSPSATDLPFPATLIYEGRSSLRLVPKKHQKVSNNTRTRSLLRVPLSPSSIVVIPSYSHSLCVYPHAPQPPRHQQHRKTLVLVGGIFSIRPHSHSGRSSLHADPSRSRLSFPSLRRHGTRATPGRIQSRLFRRRRGLSRLPRAPLLQLSFTRREASYRTRMWPCSPRGE